VKPHRWQFSTRSIFVLVAVLSAVLAFAVNLPEVFQGLLLMAVPICIVIAILQSANFATSDRRPRLATISWALLAVFFALFCRGIWSLFINQAPASDDVASLILFGVMATCCAICAYRAWRSYMQSGRPPT
jgi:hypothetical protein